MTFRMLSREVGISVNEAKTSVFTLDSRPDLELELTRSPSFPLAFSQLATFAAANPKDVHPTWILTGSLIPPQPSSQTNMDVDGDEAEGSKAVRMGVLMCTEDDVERELNRSLPLPNELM